MTPEAIVKYIETKNHTEKALNIHFKTRSTITGLFIKGNDYKELQAKNFWRIVSNGFRSRSRSRQAPPCTGM